MLSAFSNSTHSVRSLRPARSTSAMAAACGLTALLAVTAAGPASAHDELLSASPEDGATLTQAPSTMRLVFSGELIDGQGVQNILRVSDEAGNQWQDGTAVVDGDALSVPLCTGLPQGDYTAAYRAVYSDGHSEERSLDFTVADPSAPAAGTAPAGCGVAAAAPGSATAPAASASATPGAGTGSTPATASPGAGTGSTPATTSPSAQDSPASAQDAPPASSEPAVDQQADVPAGVWLAGLAGLGIIVAGVVLMGRRARSLGHR